MPMISSNAPVCSWRHNLLTGTEEAPEAFEHFGVVVEGSQVESKIGDVRGTAIFRHPLSLNHPVFGDEAVFFRKESTGRNEAA
jgi:hypothetical protein